jgi:mannose-6-phosphate isomerase-like protein (cupin superfamily)
MIGGEPVHMKPGDVVTIPPGVVHTGRADNCESCLVLDVFVPRREEYEADYQDFLRRSASAAGPA